MNPLLLLALAGGSYYLYKENRRRRKESVVEAPIYKFLPPAPGKNYGTDLQGCGRIYGTPYLSSKDLARGHRLPTDLCDFGSEEADAMTMILGAITR